MAISTLADVINGLTPTIPIMKVGAVNSANAPAGHHTYWGHIGVTTSVSWPAGAWNATLNGVNLVAPVSGQFVFPDPPAGQDAYIARAMLGIGVNSGGGVLIADRIWHNGGFTNALTTPQAIVTPAFPARDDNDSSNGVGYYCVLEVETVVTGSLFTLNYTNSDGVPNRTATNTSANGTGRSANGAFIFGLDTGDKGIKSIESLTFGTALTTGNVHLVVFRPLAFLATTAMSSNKPYIMDAISMCMPRIKPGTVPFLLGCTGNSNPGYVGHLSGEIVMTHG